MSDFDKEAEREKLREKYERDQQKREATEQMSELLLQGATMTNAHCSDCGDPVFRYDGQEFCPTCEKAVDREGTDAGDEQGGIEVTDTSETRVSFGGDADSERGQTDEPERDQQTAQHQAADPQRERARRESPQRDRSRRRAPSQDAPSDVDGGVPAARDALVDTLVRFSERAAASDDPRRARENLEAAREAADALSALDR